MGVILFGSESALLEDPQEDPSGGIFVHIYDTPMHTLTVHVLMPFVFYTSISNYSTQPNRTSDPSKRPHSHTPLPPHEILSASSTNSPKSKLVSPPVNFRNNPCLFSLPTPPPCPPQS